MNNLYQLLPSVDFLLTSLKANPETNNAPRSLLKELINNFLDYQRQNIKNKVISKVEELSINILIPQLINHIAPNIKPHFTRVLNTTGVVLHTNMGRALLAPTAVKAVQEAASYYSNLELDIKSGERGSRYSHVVPLLCKLTKAESAIVVNNNAAAVLLVLDTLCRDKEVIVSRGQLVEIGGSFRIPEVMQKSGAKLIEIGTTNRTHKHDYQKAINENTAALLKVHTSNYRIIGFNKELDLKTLVEIGQEHNVPVIEDLGSGNFCNFTELGITGLGNEPTVQQAIEDGTDIVTFSGDKVLGGPQAGIIIGRKKYIDLIAKNPLTRALRIDKMTLAALEATLFLYLDPKKAYAQIPSLKMIFYSEKELALKAKILKNIVLKTFKQHNLNITISMRKSNSRIGGGSFPERDLPTTILQISLNNMSANELKELLLKTSIPLVARIENDYLCLDPRTINNEEFKLVAQVLLEVAKNTTK